MIKTSFLYFLMICEGVVVVFLSYALYDKLRSIFRRITNAKSNN